MRGQFRMHGSCILWNVDFWEFLTTVYGLLKISHSRNFKVTASRSECQYVIRRKKVFYRSNTINISHQKSLKKGNYPIFFFVWISFSKKGIEFRISIFLNRNIKWYRLGSFSGHYYGVQRQLSSGAGNLPSRSKPF